MLRRTQQLLSHEMRWQDGNLVLDVQKASAGSWTCEGAGQVQVETSAPDRSSGHGMPAVLRDFGVETAKTFSYVRLALSRTKKTVQTGHGATTAFDAVHVYWEIRQASFVASAQFPDGNQGLADARAWLDEMRGFLALPAAGDVADVETLVLSPSAFGYLLHEGLGHRLEGDDHSLPFVWPLFQPVNFSVYDTPGKPGWAGYTPVDDAGRAATVVRLLDGSTGSQELLSRETGNLRASGLDWHPIIRQRCLVVETHSPVPPPPGGARLVVSQVDTGSLQGDEVTLFSSVQWLEFADGRRQSLPPLRLSINIRALLELSAFGESKVWHPGGGCHKGLQRGLGITFHAPSAWLDLNRTSMQVTFTEKG